MSDEIVRVPALVVQVDAAELERLREEVRRLTALERVLHGWRDGKIPAHVGSVIHRVDGKEYVVPAEQLGPHPALLEDLRKQLEVAREMLEAQGRLEWRLRGKLRHVATWLEETHAALGDEGAVALLAEVREDS